MCKSSAEVAAVEEWVRADVRGRRKERILWQDEPAKRAAMATTARAGQAQLAVKVMRDGISLALHLGEDETSVQRRVIMSATHRHSLLRSQQCS
jgi:hypothetical protein